MQIILRGSYNVTKPVDNSPLISRILNVVLFKLS